MTAQLDIIFPCYLNVHPSVHRTEILWPDPSTVRRFCTTHIGTILKLLPHFQASIFISDKLWLPQTYILTLLDKTRI